VALLGPVPASVEFEVELLGPRDAPVGGVAVAGLAEAIVAGNRDLLADARLRAWLRERGIDVLTPAELLRRREP
jgi:predicted nucleic acid-binding protein